MLLFFFGCKALSQYANDLSQSNSYRVVCHSVTVITENINVVRHRYDRRQFLLRTLLLML